MRMDMGSNTRGKTPKVKTDRSVNGLLPGQATSGRRMLFRVFRKNHKAPPGMDGIAPSSPGIVSASLYW